MAKGPSGERGSARRGIPDEQQPSPANEHARAAPVDRSRPMRVPATQNPSATATRNIV